MNRLLLVTGGARSGKSSYAQQRAEALPGEKFFLATCPAVDEEMQERIIRHQDDRHDALWQTIEEEIQIASVVDTLPDLSVCLLDCLTLWVNNLMYQAEQKGDNFREDDVVHYAHELIIAAKNFSGSLICVTNEVGLGVVPDNHLARLYRDCVGRCNRLIAEAADEVVLVSCGLPLSLKNRV